MQKTYKGQWAGGILKTAKVVRMQAGNYEIRVKDRDGRELLAYLGEDLLIGGGLSQTCWYSVTSMASWQGSACRTAHITKCVRSSQICIVRLIIKPISSVIF